MLETIAGLDSTISHGIQSLFENSILSNSFYFFSNPFAWTPFLVFIALLAMQEREGNHWLVLLFGIGAFVISYQASTWISEQIERLAPFVGSSGQTDPKIFINRGEHPWSLPDWAVASVSAACFYSIFILRNGVSRGLKIFIVLSPLFLALARIEKGLCNPSDVLAAYAIALGAGFLLSRFPENLDTLFGERR